MRWLFYALFFFFLPGSRTSSCAECEPRDLNTLFQKKKTSMRAERWYERQREKDIKEGRERGKGMKESWKMIPDFVREINWETQQTRAANWAMRPPCPPLLNEEHWSMRVNKETSLSSYRSYVFSLTHTLIRLAAPLLPLLVIICVCLFRSTLSLPSLSLCISIHLCMWIIADGVTGTLLWLQSPTCAHIVHVCAGI